MTQLSFIFFLLFHFYSVSAVVGPFFDSNQTYVILGDTFNNSISINGNFFKNVTYLNVTNSNFDVVGKCIVTSTSISPCRIKHQRWEASIAMGVLYSNPSLFLNQTCENGEPCFDENTFAAGCPALIPNICTYFRAYAKMEGPTNPKCYAFVEISLVNYTCGTNMYCNANKICVDARGNECPSTLTCTLPPLSAGIYTLNNLSNGPSIIVYPYPYVTSVSSASNYATNTTGVLKASDDTALVADIWTENIILFPTPSYQFVTPYSSSPTLLLLNVTYATTQSFIIPFNGAFVSYPKPIMYSVCPALALSFVNSTVVLQGASLVNDPSLFACTFNGQSVPYTYLSPNVIHCTVFPTTDVASIATLSVTNDGVTYADATLFIGVQGSCQTNKENSVPVNNQCECIAGYKDIGVCDQCPDGFYQPLVGQKTCLACDSTEDTNTTTANTDKSACICKEGLYRANPSDISCSPCPSGLECPHGQEIRVKQGYWRASDSDMYAIPCAKSIGGPTYGDRLCETGYMGPICAVCQEGYGFLNGNCVKCQQPSLNIFIVILIVFSVVAIVLVITRFTIIGDDEHVQNEGKLFDKNRVGMTLKIIASYFVILLYIGKLAVDWSPEARGFFNLFIPFSVSTNFVSFTCALPIDFYRHIILTMLLPVFISIAMFLVFVAINALWIVFVNRGKYHLYLTLVDYVSMTLVVVYMVHPNIAMEILRSFKCTSVMGTGTSYMADDMRVDCGSSEYLTYRVVAIVYFVAYIIGSLLVMGYQIVKRRDEIESVMKFDRNPLNWHRVFKFMVTGYRKEFYFWEIVVLARKLCIVAASSAFSPGLQLVWSSVVIAVSVALTIHYQPYTIMLVKAHMDGNNIDTVALSALAVTLILGFHSIFLGPAYDEPIFAVLVLVDASALLFMMLTIFKAAHNIAINLFEKILNLDVKGCMGEVFKKKQESEIKMYSMKRTEETTAEL